MTDRIRTALLALASGLAVAGATVAMILRVTNDMRWMLLLGAAGLFGAALWLGSRRRGGVAGFLLLCLPLMLLHAVLVVPELPALWPHLAIWLALALLGWLGFRSERRPWRAAIGALVAIAVLGSWYAFAYVPGAISGALNQLRDEPAPAIALESLDGSSYPVEALENKVVVLDFFATWCAPCVAELPEIDAIHRRYATAPDVEILVVANDSGGDTPESIQAFVAARDLDVPFVYDPGGKAHKAFGFAGLPGLVVIDRTDRIRFAREGYNAAEGDFQENLVEIIERLRAAEGPAGALPGPA
jgi:thiol-disulfide isomerase/thioredoxin